MQDKVFEASKVVLKHVFSDDYLFDMPLYQRPYSWTTDEVGELLDDLTAAMDDESSGQPYFLGSIVLVNDMGSTSYKVVDGQQRLTTLTMLLCVLRDLSENKDAQRSLDSYVCEKGDIIAGTKDRFRLSIRRDNNIFRDNVQKNGRIKDFVESEPSKFQNLPDVQQLIQKNTEMLWGRLSKEGEERRIALSSFIIQKCYFVVVSVTDSDSAHRIFSVLNARGLDLNPTDILKSEIIGNVSVSSEPEYTEIWENLEEDIGRDKFEDLFRHIHMIYVKKKPSEKVLDKSFKKEVLEESLKRMNGEKFVDAVLTPYAAAYRTVSEANYESASGAERINKCLQNLNRLNSTISFWIAPAMEFYKKHDDDADKLFRLLKDLERLTYGLPFLSVPKDLRRDRYHKVLEAFESNSCNIFEESSPLQLSDREKQEIVEELDKPLRSTNWRKPLLLLLDSLLADAEGVTYEYKTITIEHVLPQNPKEGSEWLKQFPNQDIREEWTNKIANLVLLSRSKNSRAQNYEFERKKNEYFLGKNGTTTYALTNQVITQTDWTPKVLERRQKELIDVLKKEWRLN